MIFPANLLYTKNHEWIELNEVESKIGITDFAQDQLGDIVYVDICTVGKVLKQNEVFGTIEAVKTVSDLFMPVSGEVLEINPKIISNPELINMSPYYTGWLVNIRLSKPKEQSTLLLHWRYKKVIEIEETL